MIVEAGFIVPFIPLIMSVGGAIAGGIFQNSAAQAESAQYKFNAQSEKIAADQAEVRRRNDLVSTLSAIDAVRGARGLDPTSPTAGVIASGVTKKAEQAIGTDRLNYDTRAQSDEFAATAASERGTASLIGGFLDAGKTIYSFGQDRGWWDG